MRFKFVFAVTAFSGLAWIAADAVTVRLLGGTVYGDGANLIYLPTGVAMLVLMVGKVWAAFGVAMASSLVVLRHEQTPDTFAIVATGMARGIGPYIGLQIGTHLLKIDRDLMLLRSYHLPVLALLVSAVSSLLLNTSFLLAGRKSIAQFPVDLAASWFGDFAGCMVVVLTVYAAAKLFRLLMVRR